MSEPMRWPNSENILNAADATMTGNPVNVRDFMNVALSLATASSADMTIQIQGSVLDTSTPPDFSSPASETNRWDYVACYDYSNPTSPFIGSVGIIPTGTDIVKNLLVNTDVLVWLCATVTTYSAGTVTVDAISTNNQ